MPDVAADVQRRRPTPTPTPTPTPSLITSPQPYAPHRHRSVNEQDKNIRITSADGTQLRNDDADAMNPLIIPPPPPLPPSHIKTVVRFDFSTYPCYVMSLSNLQTCDHLPTHEEAYASGLLQELTQTSMVPNGAATYFVSQNWEGETGPDNELKTKLRWLKMMKTHLNIADDREVWIWFDIYSIPRKLAKTTWTRKYHYIGPIYI